MAQHEAESRQSGTIETSHLLLALVLYYRTHTALALFQQGITAERIRPLVDALPAEAAPTTGQSQLSAGIKRSLELAVDEARRAGHYRIGTEHLLIGVLRAPDKTIDAVFAVTGASREAVAAALRAQLGIEPSTYTRPPSPQQSRRQNWVLRLLNEGLGLRLSDPSPVAETPASTGESPPSEPRRTDDLITIYTQLMDSYPDKVWLLEQRAAEHFRRHQFDQAVADYTAVLNQNPEDFVTRRNRAAAYMNTRRYELALADINECIRLKPEAEYYFLRAEIFFYLSDHDNSLKDCEWLIEHFPEVGSSFVRRAMIYHEQLDYDRALDDVKTALSLLQSRPDDRSLVTLYGIRGSIHMDQGNYQAARADFVQANHLLPDETIGYSQLALLSLIEKQADHALHFAESALARSDYDGRAHYVKASLLAAKGDVKGAVEDYRRALEFWQGINTPRSQHYVEEMRAYLAQHDTA